MLFGPPQKTLKKSLHTVLDNALEYVADVCFEFPEGKIWAHRAILLARIPKKFRQHHLSLLCNEKEKSITVDISSVIPYTTFQTLLRFWYTSEFYPEQNNPQATVDSPSSVGSTISNGSTFSTTSTKTSLSSYSNTNSTNNNNNNQDELIYLKQQSNSPLGEIEQLEERLGFKLLPESTMTTTSTTTPTTTTSTTTTTTSNTSKQQPVQKQQTEDFERLVSDLENMRGQQLGSDVMVTLFTPAPPPSVSTSSGNNNNNKKSSISTLNASSTSTTTPPAPTSSNTNNTIMNKVTGKEIPSILFTHTDVPTPSTPSSHPTTPTSSSSYPAHRFILASQSPYFYAMFCTQFREASSSTVHLPGDLFTPITTQVILRYFYSDTLVIPPLRHLPTSPAQRRLTEKKHALRILQQVFPAADYLGHFDTICEAILHEMDRLCHGFKCVCTDCATLLPSMLWFADKHVTSIPLLRPALMTLYSDPVHSIAPLWSQQSFAVLVGHMAPTASSLAEYTIASIFCNMDNHASTPNTLVAELSQQTLDNVTKHNAIHVLHSLHLCLSQIRSANPFPTWSIPALDLLHPILHHTIDMISRNFDFYCVEYPILLSCVDGIGVGFSVDFLEFLLKKILVDGIRDTNAGVLYQGIVRDLVGRQEVVKNVAVDGVLLDARNQCAEYLARRWVQVKAQGGFHKIDKDVMRSLSDDIGVPYRALTKPIESDFAAMFGFKSKPGKLKSKSSNSDESSTKNGYQHQQQQQRSSGPRRLSLSGLRPQRSNGALKTQEAADMARVTRTRSLSNEAIPSRPMISETLSAESINKLSKDGLSSQPLIHLLSLESEARRQRQEDQTHQQQQNHTISHYPTSAQQQQQQQLQQHTHQNTNNNSHHPTKQTYTIMDALLPLSSTITEWTPVEEDDASNSISSSTSSNHRSSNNKNSNNNNNNTQGNNKNATSTTSTGRQTRLKFELPTTPLRAKSPVQKPFLAPSSHPNTFSDGHSSQRRGRSPRKSRWGIGSSSSDVSDDEELVTMVTPVIGAKVELLRRPLPTLGTIKYVGPVNFARGTWVGVELESRLGKNDGQIDGVRYFRTDPQRGVFVKIDDFKVISLPHVQTI
ncbi:hypothetical protein BDA99DRAFT_536649 [Phascolomyces articulosus]|uniref:CAP-Gly domain-containing protein n=1 Tax=Phascolomyces articulosus TaxID=60185 RepID=A0AAD5PEY2_9FUNG|nr:hypothetical protein BDA99DRAFT_536649 [Phascolomyces articulosus]